MSWEVLLVIGLAILVEATNIDLANNTIILLLLLLALMGNNFNFNFGNRCCNRNNNQIGAFI